MFEESFGKFLATSLYRNYFLKLIKKFSLYFGRKYSQNYIFQLLIV